MRHLRMGVVGVSIAIAVLFIALPALADVAIRLDFDNDGDPATLRTLLPTGQTSAVARFVLEVTSLPLPTEMIWVAVEEGCCDAPEWIGNWGTRVEYSSIGFDPLYVAEGQADFPLCTYCCPWMLRITLAPDAPVVAGGRYFIGQATWNADCFVEAACTPSTTFTLGDQGPLGFTCEVIPVEAPVWGSVKAAWR